MMRHFSYIFLRITSLLFGYVIGACFTPILDTVYTNVKYLPLLLVIYKVLSTQTTAATTVNTTMC